MEPELSSTIMRLADEPEERKGGTPTPLPQTCPEPAVGNNQHIQSRTALASAFASKGIAVRLLFFIILLHAVQPVLQKKFRRVYRKNS
jgi:hypothetical protein